MNIDQIDEFPDTCFSCGRKGMDYVEWDGEHYCPECFEEIKLEEDIALGKEPEEHPDRYHSAAEEDRI